MKLMAYLTILLMLMVGNNSFAVRGTEIIMGSPVPTPQKMYQVSVPELDYNGKTWELFTLDLRKNSVEGCNYRTHYTADLIKKSNGGIKTYVISNLEGPFTDGRLRCDQKNEYHSYPVRLKNVDQEKRKFIVGNSEKTFQIPEGTVLNYKVWTPSEPIAAKRK